MLDLIKKWLTGGKEFFTGVIIYRKLPKQNQRLADLLSQGPTDFARQKLHEALRAAYLELKANEEGLPDKTGVVVRNVVLKQTDTVEQVTTAVIPNPELYQASKNEADNLYKEIMNDRAVLFSLAAQDPYSDPNLPDKIEARRKLSIAVVTGFQRVSELYDRADYVKAHGELPNQPPPDPDDQVAHVPDHMVKQTLDNLRKNYNKTKNKPETAERIVKLQQMIDQIKKLEER